MSKRKLTFVIAIFMSVIMIGSSLMPALAEPVGADELSVMSSNSWSSFPVQKRWSYSSGYTYAIQTVLWNLSSDYRQFGTIDGKYGPGTVEAVTLYQKNKKLEVDGQTGPETWTALFDELAPLSGMSVGPDSTGASPYQYYVMKNAERLEKYAIVRFYNDNSGRVWQVKVGLSWVNINK